MEMYHWFVTRPTWFDQPAAETLMSSCGEITPNNYNGAESMQRGARLMRRCYPNDIITAHVYYFPIPFPDDSV